MWQRGLVRKGLGLCHGISGNGYAFLSAFRATQNVEYLQQARGFALYAAQVREAHRAACLLRRLCCLRGGGGKLRGSALFALLVPLL